MLTRFDEIRIRAEAKAAAERGESMDSCPYAPHTPAWRLYQRVHSVSSLMATDPARLLCSVPASSRDQASGETLKSSDPQGDSK